MRIQRRFGRGLPLAVALLGMLIMPVTPVLAQGEPDCSTVTASHSSLDKSGDFTAVALAGVTDPDGGTVTLVILGVTQDEPTSGLTPQDEGPDAILTGGNSASLRGERDVKGDGRWYSVAFRATDADGMSCTGTVGVEVRRWKMIRAIDSGQSYDSLT